MNTVEVYSFAKQFKYEIIFFLIIPYLNCLDSLKMIYLVSLLVILVNFLNIGKQIDLFFIDNQLDN